MEASFLEEGLSYHRSGNLSAARIAYDHVLRLQPGHAHACYLLGMTFAQEGALEQAVLWLRAALEAQPDYCDALLHLGSALVELHQSVEALPLLRRAVQICPENGNVHYALANAQRDCGYLLEAVCSYRLALQRLPNLIPAYNNLGNTLRQQGNYQDAADCLREAAHLAPGEWRVHASLSGALHSLGHLEEAACSARRALSLQPHNADLAANLSKILWVQGKGEEARRCLLRVLPSSTPDANALLTLGSAFHALCDYPTAEDCFQQVLRLAPQCAEAHVQLGGIFWVLGSLAQAETCFRTALTIEPTHVHAHLQLSRVLISLNQVKETIHHLQAVLDMDADHAEANCMLGEVYLKQRDWARGWKLYDHIHRLDLNTPRRFMQPRWDGSDLHGRTLLLHAQFGIGDTLQCVRYLPLVKAKGGRIVLECQWQLAPLLENCIDADEIVARTPARGDKIPDVAHDVHFNLMSLPALFASDETTMLGTFPYIQPSHQASEEWRHRFQDMRGLKVGIVWSASTQGIRSCSALDFLDIAQMPGISVFCLQKGLEAHQATVLQAQAPVCDLAPYINNFADTAAILANLDLIISVDTSMAHLAGAMNRPAWTLLSYSPDWRWQMEREDSPWYPSMRLFRQERPGDWSSVFARVQEQLTDWRNVL